MRIILPTFDFGPNNNPVIGTATIRLQSECDNCGVQGEKVKETDMGDLCQECIDEFDLEE